MLVLGSIGILGSAMVWVLSENDNLEVFDQFVLKKVKMFCNYSGLKKNIKKN